MPPWFGTMSSTMSSPSPLPPVVYPPLEHRLALVQRDARAVVLDGDPGDAALSGQRLDRDGHVLAAVLDGVAKEVLEDALELPGADLQGREAPGELHRRAGCLDAPPGVLVEAAGVDESALGRLLAGL
jgi:hypothetical protein